MRSIVFVPSLNGLGHARRLFVLASEAVSRGFRVRIVLSSTQAKKLRVEFGGETAGLDVIESNQLFEVDGPSFGVPSKQEISRVPRDLSNVIDESTLCISDNLLWPSRFARKLVVLGNFLWSEYWESRGQRDIRLVDYPVVERPYVPEATLRLANRGLAFGANRWLPVSGHYSFVRYPGDLASQEKPLSGEAWYSRGTTGLSLSAKRTGKAFGLENPKILAERESWELASTKAAPSLIVGRPGLGTLRDAMAAGIPFLPLAFEKSDPEMHQNEKFAISHFSLPPRFFSPTGGLEEALKEAHEFAFRFRKANLEKWFAISAEPARVLREIDRDIFY